MAMAKQVTTYEHECDFCEEKVTSDSRTPPDGWFYFSILNKPSSAGGFPALMRAHSRDDHLAYIPMEIATLEGNSWCTQSCLISWLIRRIGRKTNQELPDSMGD